MLVHEMTGGLIQETSLLNLSVLLQFLKNLQVLLKLLVPSHIICNVKSRACFNRKRGIGASLINRTKGGLSHQGVVRI